VFDLTYVCWLENCSGDKRKATLVWYDVRKFSSIPSYYGGSHFGVENLDISDDFVAIKKTTRP
jgi:hypothetical protein